MTVQLWVRTEDTIGTEPPILQYKGHFNDPDEAILLENDMDCYKAFEKSILEEGFKYCVAMDKNGKIHDGNCRRHVAIKNKLPFLPINADFYFGIDLTFYPKKEVK